MLQCPRILPPAPLKPRWIFPRRNVCEPRISHVLHLARMRSSHGCLTMSTLLTPCRRPPLLPAQIERFLKQALQNFARKDGVCSLQPKLLQVGFAFSPLASESRGSLCNHAMHLKLCLTMAGKTFLKLSADMSFMRTPFRVNLLAPSHLACSRRRCQCFLLREFRAKAAS